MRQSLAFDTRVRRQARGIGKARNQAPSPDFRRSESIFAQ
jgi:hypothetical protein